MKIENQKHRIYGRSRGRLSRNIKTQTYLDLISPYKFSSLSKKDKYILDIGTGYGETSIYFSLQYSNYKIITCDKYIDGNLNLLKTIKKEKINNIQIHNGSIHEILDNNQKNNYFELVSIFFPDPWPKNKHSKRRLIQNSFLKKIHNYMKDNGKLYIASDSKIYIRHIFKCIYHSRDIFNWLNPTGAHLSVKDYFNIETKFYKKAIISGRKPILFILQKL